MTPDVTHTKLWVELPHEIYIYFFRKIFAGDRGIKQKLSLKFYQALYVECQKQGIKGEWDPDNYQKITDIMSRLNFNDHKSPRPRRTTTSSTKHQAQPTSGGDDARSTDGTDQEATDFSDIATDPLRPT